MRILSSVATPPAHLQRIYRGALWRLLAGDPHDKGFKCCAGPPAIALARLLQALRYAAQLSPLSPTGTHSLFGLRAARVGHAMTARRATNLAPLLCRLVVPLLLLAVVFVYAVYHVTHQVLAQAELHYAGIDAALHARVDRQFGWIVALLALAFCLAVMVIQRMVVAPLKALTRAAATPEFAFVPIKTSGVFAREIGLLAEALKSA